MEGFMRGVARRRCDIEPYSPLAACHQLDRVSHPAFVCQETTNGVQSICATHERREKLMASFQCAPPHTCFCVITPRFGGAAVRPCFVTHPENHYFGKNHTNCYDTLRRLRTMHVPQRSMWHYSPVQLDTQARTVRLSSSSLFVPRTSISRELLLCTC